MSSGDRMAKVRKKKHLVIVESPAKAKTIARFLGPEYRVEASYGHIRDLPGSAREVPSRFRSRSWARLGVNVEAGFKPVYVVPKESRRRVQELKRMLEGSDELILATDEDREGESISWHLLQELKPDIPVRRIAFHEITRQAIQDALATPRGVDERLVQAQEARRVLDRLFGYELSPVLWKRVRTRLSAGRVQSVALRLIVEREEERQRFRVSEYWNVEAELGAPGGTFKANLAAVAGCRIANGRDFDSTTGELKADSDARPLGGGEAERISEVVLEAVPWVVAQVEMKETIQRPPPPLITSTLQQAASATLRMSPKETMRIAQRLYEGVDLGGGEREGLITYMRTDSVTLSEKALGDAARLIRSEYGDRYYSGPRRYKTRSKMAQEAHEAIRPTEIARTPHSVRAHLKKGELALYRLIWERTVASQMADARVDQTTAEFVAESGEVEYTFRANGSVLRFDGFRRVYGGGKEDVVLPPLDKGEAIGGPGDTVKILQVKPERRETRPPPRYTEASLVKKLEEEGIGRPSTYTPTISTIQEREYVVKKGGVLVPTFVGMAVTRLLRDHFEEYVDVGFTARMEDSLDEIATGDVDAGGFLATFYWGDEERNGGLLGEIEGQMPSIEFPAIPLGPDPGTGRPVTVRVGRDSTWIQRGEGQEAERVTLPEGLLIDELTMEKALELIDVRARAEEPLGLDESGRPIFVKIGKYGPYLEVPAEGEGGKPRRMSLPRDLSVEGVTLKRARQILALPRMLGEDPETGETIEASLGRFGPYVKRGRTYRNLESAETLFGITLEEALELLREKPGGRALRELGEHPETGAALRVLEGRYGPYVTDGAVNATIPKDRHPQQLTLEDALSLLADAASKGRRRGGRRRRKKN